MGRFPAREADRREVVMTPLRRSQIVLNCIFFAGLLMTMLAGCGFERIQPSLPDLNDLTLARLEEIQDDERLTNAEKRQAIRDEAGIPDTVEGDRLVDFLLAFNVP